MFEFLAWFSMIYGLLTAATWRDALVWIAVSIGFFAAQWFRNKAKRLEKERKSSHERS